MSVYRLPAPPPVHRAKPTKELSAGDRIEVVDPAFDAEMHRGLRGVVTALSADAVLVRLELTGTSEVFWSEEIAKCTP